MNKKTIRLTESDLHRVIKESVNRILNESQQIVLQYQVKKPIHMFSTDLKDRYEVKELVYPCDSNKTDRENLDDAYSKACEMGANPDKQIRWRFVNESVNRILNESFAEQWEDEIKIFMKGLKNGQAIVTDNGVDVKYVAVEWGHSDKDPRFIYYEEGDDRLTDDHFSQQHSRRLTQNELSEIKYCAKRYYGEDIYIPDDEYYDEDYD